MSNNFLQELKERIFDEGLIGKLLEELGCDNIAPPKRQPNGTELVTAQAPDSKNKRGIQVYLSPTLHCEIVNEGISGDIFAVVAFLLFGSSTFDEVKSNLYQIKVHICDLLGFDDLLNQKYKPETPKVDWNYWLRPIQDARVRVLDISENEILDEMILLEFVEYPWQNWLLEDGISWEAQNEFEIGFHVLTERVTIPIRNKQGKLIGVKGRLCHDSETNPKYIYIYSCAKSIELFNLHRALPYIQESKKVIVVEAAKTVIKMWGWGVRNVVSIEGDRVSPVQIKLLKECGLDVEIIFSFDKDKDREFIERQIKLIKNRTVYYLFDTQDRFVDKQSPADIDYNTFIDLLENDIVKFTQ